MKEDNTPTVTFRRRTPSTKVRLRLETAKRVTAINSKHKSSRARKKEAKIHAGETDAEAHVLTTQVPRIKKNKFAEPPKATSKFKKRQIHKTWLPTHLWHAKRARMTRPSEPLWRMAIPLTPTEKSYRPTHRASGSRGAVAWDTSYISTIGCEGIESSLVAMLKAMGFGEDYTWGAKGAKWRKGTRSASGCAYERDNEKRLIAPITVLWETEHQKSSVDRSQKSTSETTANLTKNADIKDTKSSLPPTTGKPAKRKLLLRVHPSAFHQLWTELLKVADMQRPAVVLEDLRFEIASFEVVGSGSTEALCAVLKPTAGMEMSAAPSTENWPKLAGLTNPASLPLGAILSLNISDPRLVHPRKSLALNGDDANDSLIDLLIDWPPDREEAHAALFSHKARIAASRSLPSQKAIHRRKGLAQPGEAPASKEGDPQIPVMLLASRPNLIANNTQGTWTVLLPWRCLDPIWRCLMYYPLSSGDTPRFGGLDEIRQIAFERSEPWFPGDFPGTKAGKAWQRTEAEKQHNVWKRKPPSRRVNYDALQLGGKAKGEHGVGWRCDWEFLLGSNVGKSDLPSTSEKKQESSNVPSTESEPRTDTGPIQSSSSIGTTNERPSPPTVAATTIYTQIPPTIASTFINSSSISVPASLPSKACLATVRITLLTCGTPLPCARIYRLPSSSSSMNHSSLRTKWLSLDPHSNYSTTTSTFAKTKKTKINWRGDTANHSAYDDEHADIDAINYQPPNMVPEAIADWEKKKAELKTKRQKFQNQKSDMRAGERISLDDTEDRTAEEREELLRELMRPSADKEDTAPDCPGVEDLIGFVTTGGYNLRLGKGTAIGAVWVQRVLEEWDEERNTGAADTPREAKRLKRERSLCVVRNAGERVGRLGVWEVCD
jgi:ribonuclease P/MRP protein subunit POP1